MWDGQTVPTFEHMMLWFDGFVVMSSNHICMYLSPLFSMEPQKRPLYDIKKNISNHYLKYSEDTLCCCWKVSNIKMAF